MPADVRATVAALEAAIEDQRRYVIEVDEGYETGYLDGLERPLDAVQITAYGLKTGVELIS